MDQLLCVINEFQTLIVGTIGFIGVIFTIYKNSAMAQEERESVRNHDKAALRTAIYCELLSIKESFQTRADDLKAQNNSGCLLPESILTTVFDSMHSQIGILDIDEISKIIKSYLLIKELPRRLKFLSVESSSSGVYEGYIFVGREFTDTARGIHENFIVVINEALNAVKLRLVQEYP